MGVGRFAYTPLLVLMRGDAGLTVAFAGVLASANLAGYLAGALFAMQPVARRHRLALVRAGAALVVLSTAMMAWPFEVWSTARALTGIASGIVFVLTVSLSLDLAAETRSRHGLAISFSGVGIGIATAGALVPPFATFGGSRAAWLGLAASSAIVLVFALPALREARAALAPVPAPVRGAGPGLFGWLAALYGIEGAAYIVPATFLVAIVSETPALAPYGAAAWILVGAVAAPSTLVWSALALRSGLGRALAAACAVQGAAMLAPFVAGGPTGAIVLATGLGLTFIGISQLATALARTLRPDNANAAIGLVTALYGVGQVIGPLAATRIALATGSYRFALPAAAAALLLATAAFALRLARASPKLEHSG